MHVCTTMMHHLMQAGWEPEQSAQAYGRSQVAGYSLAQEASCCTCFLLRVCCCPSWSLSPAGQTDAAWLAAVLQPLGWPSSKCIIGVPCKLLRCMCSMYRIFAINLGACWQKHMYSHCWLFQRRHMLREKSSRQSIEGPAQHFLSLHPARPEMS